MSVNTRAPSTIITITLTGQTEFNIPFEYLARKYVEVTLLGINRLPLVLNTDFRFVTKTMISLTRPYTSDYTQIEIRRVTSATERLVDFHDGSILRAYDLNLSQIQTLHVAEEARDLTADTIGVNDEGHLDARNRKIVNLAYAEDGGDAIPLGQVMQWNESALNSKIAAEAARDIAEASASIAVSAKDAARLSELNAQNHDASSALSAQDAEQSKTASEAAMARSELARDRAEAAAAPAIEVFNRLEAVETQSQASSDKVDAMDNTKYDKAGGDVSGDMTVKGVLRSDRILRVGDVFELSLLDASGGSLLKAAGYNALVSENDEALVGNNFTTAPDGTFVKLNVEKPSNLFTVEHGSGRLAHYVSPAGNPQVITNRAAVYTTINPPAFGWRLVKDGSVPWHINQNWEFGVDMRSKMVMFEVSHLGGGSTSVACTNDGSASCYWMYGNWEYHFRWNSQSNFNMDFVSANTESPIYRVWIWDVIG